MGTDLITDYLDALRVRLRSRLDADDLVDEAEDHLRGHVDDLVRAGHEPSDATRLALEAFGEPDVVARAHLTAPNGALAVPTVSTRAAGTLAAASAWLWILGLAIWGTGAALDDVLRGSAPDYAFYFAGVLALAVASALMSAVALALRDRHGGSFGAIGIALMLVGSVSAFFIGWAVPVWMSLLGIGAAIVAVSILRRPIAPRGPTILLGIALPLGAVAFVIARALELGRPDENGDYWVAIFAALVVGCGLSAAAMFATGRWLSREEPFVLTDGATAPPT